MKRRKFLKSTLAAGGAAAATAGIGACSVDVSDCGETAVETGPLTGFTRLGKIAARPSDQIEHSYWGIQAGAYDEETLAKAQAIGVKWTRTLAGWPNVEKEKGSYDWTDLDTAIDALLRYGITPFVTVTRGNPLYTKVGTYDDPKLAAIYGDSPAPPTEPDAIAAWLEFVTATVNRYKDRIRYWEIWNEPNHRNYWGAPPNPVDYGNLVRVTSERIRELHPDAKIIAGSTAGISASFHDGYLGQCDPQNLDIISFHNYGNRPEDRVYSIGAFREVLAKYKPELEVWQGECGIASQSRTTGYRGTGPWGETIQAKWLLRQSFVDTYYCGATLSNYFKLFSNGELDPPDTERELSELDKVFGAPERNGSRMHARGVNEKCIIYTADRSPKPAYYAYQNLCAAMDASYKKEELEYTFTVADAGSFHGIGEYEDAFPSVPLLASYRSDKASLFAVWLPWIPQEAISKFATVSLEIAASFREPVLLDLLNGEVYALEEFESNAVKTTFGRLPLADYPLVVAERDEIAV